MEHRGQRYPATVRSIGWCLAVMAAAGAAGCVFEESDAPDVANAVAHIHGEVHQLFVSPTGSDLNPGTREAPFATLRKALTSAAPGYEIRLLPGVHTVLMGASPVRFINGAPENPIVITSDSNNPAEYAVFDGGIELTEGVAPGGENLTLRDNQAIYLRDCSWITIQNLKFQRVWPIVIHLRDSSFITVRGNRISSGWRTIQLRDARTHHVLIENNTMEMDERAWTTWDWASMHHGLTPDPTVPDGTYEMSHLNNQLVFARGSTGSVVMRGNRMRNMFNGYRTRSTDGQNLNGNVDIYENRFFNIRDNAFEPEAYVFNVHFHHNRLFNVYRSISIDGVGQGPVYVYGNVIGQELNPVMGPRYIDEFGVPQEFQEISGIWKFFTATAILGEPVVDPHFLSQPLWAFNNSIYTEADAFPDLVQNDIEFLEPEHNLRHFNNAYHFIKGGTLGLNGPYWHPTYQLDDDAVNLAVWPANVTANGQETSGQLVSNLGFLDAPNMDFRLSDTSPLKDAGRVISLPELGWTQSFRDAAPDVGAFEKHAPADGPPFRYREPNGGPDVAAGGDGYLERPRIVKHDTDGSELVLWWSAPLNAATVSAAAIIVIDATGVEHVATDATVSADGYTITVEHGAPSVKTIRFAPLPLGANGASATLWASTL
jgi:hypothetical protein